MRKKISLFYPYIFSLLIGGLSVWCSLAFWLDSIGSRLGLLLEDRYDYIVVAGQAVNSKGKPGECLKNRLNLAADLFAKGMAYKIVLTGGLGWIEHRSSHY